MRALRNAVDLRLTCGLPAVQPVRGLAAGTPYYVEGCPAARRAKPQLNRITPQLRALLDGGSEDLK